MSGSVLINLYLLKHAYRKLFNVKSECKRVNKLYCIVLLSFDKYETFASTVSGGDKD